MTTTLLILCGAGIGSLVTLCALVFLGSRTKANNEEFMLETKKCHCETLCELKRRNELLIEANEIAKHQMWTAGKMLDACTEQFGFLKSLNTQPVTIEAAKSFSGEVK